MLDLAQAAGGVWSPLLSSSTHALNCDDDSDNDEDDDVQNPGLAVIYQQ